MKNFEKYKTAEERREAFKKVYHDSFYTGIDPFDWLDLEAEEEKPLPCPFCGHNTTVASCRVDPDGVYVTCTFCDYRSMAYKGSDYAIAMHNIVARAVIDAKAKEAAK